MGVHNLWELLSPVGRRVSVETLAGKKLAIDASIWMVQFMKAMRDEKGDMVRNAHLLGFFRRICKLLYLRTKPVFVFDGGTPVLKRRTVIARRRQRENAQAKIRKTAEKLLLNHLKKMRLKELADDLDLQRKLQKKDKLSTGEACQTNIMMNGQKLGEHSEVSKQISDFSSSTSKAAGTIPLEGEHVDEDWDLAEIDGNIDPDVLAALPSSMQQKFLVQNEPKGKSVIHDGSGQLHEENSQQKNVEASSCYGQERLDEMLAASLMAEEGQGKTHCPSTSAATFPSVEEDDEEEEMLLPEMNGNVDPAVLAALPPSMQLDLLVQMRERLIAENRQKYQKVNKAPEKFSELQIQSYLKTVAFRREIDEVQKAASGRGISGVQTSRIASEANREFIFSSSFTGDKQALKSARVEKIGDKQTQTMSKHSSELVSSVNVNNKSNGVAELDTNDPGNAAQEAVETYVDERGRTRVSRVRAMGIRMTRDLQRNLDLMKEIEREKADSRNALDDQPAQDKETESSLKCPSGHNNFAESMQGGSSGVVEEPSLLNETSVEVTFGCDGEDIGFDEDDIFARLAAGDPIQEPSAQISPPIEKSINSDSDVDWEEASIQEDSGNRDDVNVTRETFSHESDVDWEESSKCPESSYRPDESTKSFSKGSLEEEADLQEAIRRSLSDLNGIESSDISAQIEKAKIFGEVSSQSMGVLMKEQNEEVILGEISVTDKLCCEVSLGVGELSDVGNAKASDTVGSSAAQVSSDQTPKPGDKHTDSSSKHLGEYTHCNINIDKKLSFVESATCLEGKEDPLNWNAHDEGGQPLTSCSECHRDSSRNVTDNLADSIFLGNKCNLEPVSSVLLGERKEQNESSVFLMESDRIKLASDLFAIDEKVAKTSSDALLNEGLMKTEEVPINYNINNNSNDNNTPTGFTEANLHEELLILGEEWKNLGDEQKKLERNAESASSEMFAECQELLQMFGLPYIIAPMEAEAQCAYLELANLVDGVVTDDSDVFLFGARNVYKNIFDDRKYVETYFMEDIEKELGLTREKLIRMALLLGSDYTEGVSGIGIVNAIEVLNAFPEDDGLSRFREWIESPDPSILGGFDINGGSHLRKRGSRNSDKDVSSGNDSTKFCPSSGESPSDQNISQADVDPKSSKMEDIKQKFMDKHRNVSKNWHMPHSFPSKDVIMAYSSPQVDNSTEPFSWGKPDLFVLRRLCWEKFGWGSQKTDELLTPVLKEFEKRETQLRLEAFYTFNERFAKIRSKRIKKAVKGITGNISSEVVDDCTEDVKRVSKKRKDDAAGSGGQTVTGIRKKRKNSAELERGKGLGAGSGRGRGRGKTTYDFEHSETSTSDDGTIDEHHVSTKKFEQLQEVRRSVRARKPVNYTLSDDEIDETSTPQKDEELPRAEANEQVSFETQDKYGGFCVGAAFNDEKNMDEESNLPVERPCRESLIIGGGFYSDEGKDANRDNDSSPDGGLSKGYLESGGGFCMDDDDDDDDDDNDANEGRTNAALNPDTLEITEPSDTPSYKLEDINSLEPVGIPCESGSCSGMVAEDDRGTADVSAPIVASSVIESRLAESPQDPANNIKLSAMPCLKRKRRKS